MEQEKPFVIWTMRRTGGTTLADFLTSQSVFPKTVHEPFNWERNFGWVTKAWSEDRNYENLTKNMSRVLHLKPNVKHCYELHHNKVSEALLKCSSSKGYAHIVLDRHAETDRILSLELAQVTGAWGKMGSERKYEMFRSGEAEMPAMDVESAIAHMKECHSHRERLATALVDAEVEPFVVYFEDLYTDLSAGRAQVMALLEHVGIDPTDREGFDNALDDAITHNGQNSASMMELVPNIEQMREKLTLTAAMLDQVFAPSR